MYYLMDIVLRHVQYQVLCYFLIYVNSMSNVSQLFFTLLFAHDTNVFTIGIDVRQLLVIINKEGTKHVEWLNVKTNS